MVMLIQCPKPNIGENGAQKANLSPQRQAEEETVTNAAETTVGRPSSLLIVFLAF